MTKLAIVILFCCISVAFQQQYHQQQRFYIRPPLRYYSPAARPLFFPSYGYSDQYLQLLANYYSDPTENNDYPSELEGSETEGRVPAGFPNGSPQAKFFGFGMASLLSSLLTANLNSLITVTSTVLSTITSTASIVSVRSCIGTSQFVDGSTNTCSRKRRGINVQEIEALAAIDPTPIEPMGATIAPDAFSLRQGRNQNHETEIVSSLIDQQLLVDDSQPMSRQKRRAVIVTVTSTITSFVLTTTSITKSFTLVDTAANANVLQCVPTGFTIC